MQEGIQEFVLLFSALVLMLNFLVHQWLLLKKLSASRMILCSAGASTFNCTTYVQCHKMQTSKWIIYVNVYLVLGSKKMTTDNFYVWYYFSRVKQFYPEYSKFL